MISEIKNDIIRKRVVSNISCNANNAYKNVATLSNNGNNNQSLSKQNINPCIIPIMSTKTKAKRQIVNYNNYVPILQAKH